MKRTTKIAMGLVLILLGVMSALICLLLGGSLHRTKYLRMGEVEVKDDTYHAQFFEGNETAETASVYIVVSERSPEGHCRMLIEICHEENTVLDTMSLTFNSVQPADALAYHASESASWPPVEYHVSSNGGEVEYVVREFGFMGTGTVRMEFTLDAEILGPLPSDQLRLDVAFTTDEEGWAGSTKQMGQGTICLEGIAAA